MRNDIQHFSWKIILAAPSWAHSMLVLSFIYKLKSTHIENIKGISSGLMKKGIVK